MVLETRNSASHADFRFLTIIRSEPVLLYFCCIYSGFKTVCAKGTAISFLAACMRACVYVCVFVSHQFWTPFFTFRYFVHCVVASAGVLVTEGRSTQAVVFLFIFFSSFCGSCLCFFFYLERMVRSSQSLLVTFRVAFYHSRTTAVTDFTAIIHTYVCMRETPR